MNKFKNNLTFIKINKKNLPVFNDFFLMLFKDTFYMLKMRENRQFFLKNKQNKLTPPKKCLREFFLSRS